MLKLFFMLALLMAYTAAKATDYRVICAVKEHNASKLASTYNILLELDVEPRYFRHFIQVGQSFKRLRDGFPHGVDDRRVLMVNDGVTQEYYDRIDKHYFYKNDASGVEIRGECVPASKR